MGASIVADWALWRYNRYPFGCKCNKLKLHCPRKGIIICVQEGWFIASASKTPRSERRPPLLFASTSMMFSPGRSVMPLKIADTDAVGALCAHGLAVNAQRHGTAVAEHLDVCCLACAFRVGVGLRCRPSVAGSSWPCRRRRHPFSHFAVVRHQSLVVFRCLVGRPLFGGPLRSQTCSTRKFPIRRGVR